MKMKCPHCSRSIGLFSDEMKVVGKTNVCIYCGKRVKLGIIHSRFALGFVPVALAAVLLGLSGPVAAGIAGSLGAMVGLGLKSSDG